MFGPVSNYILRRYPFMYHDLYQVPYLVCLVMSQIPWYWVMSHRYVFRCESFVLSYHLYMYTAPSEQDKDNDKNDGGFFEMIAEKLDLIPSDEKDKTAAAAADASAGTTTQSPRKE